MGAKAGLVGAGATAGAPRTAVKPRLKSEIIGARLTLTRGMWPACGWREGSFPEGAGTVGENFLNSTI